MEQFMSRDFAILRETWPRGQVCSWGIGPVSSPGRVATRLGLSRATVQAHLRRWRETGFYCRAGFAPNATALGVELVRTEIAAQNPLETERILDKLQLIDGVLAAGSYHGGSWRGGPIDFVSVISLADGPSSVARRHRLLLELSLLRRIAGPFPYSPPICSTTLSLLDWKIVHAMMVNSSPHFEDLADEFGVSSKTIRRHYRRLVEARALLYRPMFDWSRFPALDLSVVYTEPRCLTSIRRQIETDLGSYLAINLEGDWPPEAGSIHSGFQCWAAVVPSPTPGAVQRTVGKLLAMPGVVDVRTQVNVSVRWYASRWMALVEGKLRELNGSIPTRIFGH
jgi:DNA-binding Lrp family transcriptional regulator